MNKKIIITGTTCSGKTTLGKKLSKRLNIRQVDLDDLYFLPNWIEKDRKQFINDVSAETSSNDEWIITGGYQTVLKDSVWKEASTIIWLDYPLGLIIHRYFIRTTKRLVYKEKCCGENYETFWRVFSRNSLFFWIFKSYWRRKKRMKEWKNGIFSDKNWIILNNPKNANNLLSSL
jgi:adenylate kinase family enzyme